MRTPLGDAAHALAMAGTVDWPAPMAENRPMSTAACMAAVFWYAVKHSKMGAGFTGAPSGQLYQFAPMDKWAAPVEEQQVRDRPRPFNRSLQGPSTQDPFSLLFWLRPGVLVEPPFRSPHHE